MIFDAGNVPPCFSGLDTTPSPVNDAPVLSNLNGESSSQVVQGGGATAVSDMADITVSDVDSADFNGGTLTLSQGVGTMGLGWRECNQWGRWHPCRCRDHCGGRN
jgi:hypothetical protein